MKSHVSFLNNSKKHCSFGFTLAEVLVTLGVIGVVAALTIPSIIQNIQKKTIAVQLKHSYAIMSNVFSLAEVDYGEMSSWGLNNYFGKEYDSKEIIKNFSELYVYPYLQRINVNTNTSLSELGYKTSINKPDGSAYVSLNAVLRSALVPKDGSLILFTTTSLSNSKTLSGILIAIDVNGPKGPNKLGKDVFKAKVSFFDGVFSMERPISTRIKTLPDGSVVVEKFEYTKMTRIENINFCKTQGLYCGLLIQQDGWEIKDDYPW